MCTRHEGGQGQVGRHGSGGPWLFERAVVVIVATITIIIQNNTILCVLRGGIPRPIFPRDLSGRFDSSNVYIIIR